MEEQEKKDVNEQAVNKVMEIKNNIGGFISRIEGSSGLLISLIKKEEFNADDLSKSFDIVDEIQIEAEKIMRLLFVLKGMPGGL